MEETTEWRGQDENQIEGKEKRSGRLVGAAETTKKLTEWRWFQQRNLNILGLLKRKVWLQCHRESSWQGRRSRPCQKEKEQSRQSRVPWRVRGESERVHEEERVDSTVKEGRFQREKGSKQEEFL